MKIAMIVAAAGSSTRFGKGNKLTEMLGDAPVLIHSLRTFGGHPGVFALIVAAPAGKLEEYRALAEHYLPRLAVRWVPGGATRAQSVRNALSAVPEECGLVAVHDGARPLATASLLDALAEAAERTGGAIPGKPVADTLKRRSASGFCEGTVDRSVLWAVETPQVFRTSLLRRAYATDVDPTDEAGAMEAMGFPVEIVRSPDPNLKLTTPADLETLRFLIGRRGEDAR